MNINKYGAVFLKPEEALNALYSGKLKDLSAIFLDDPAEVKKFNQNIKINFDQIAPLLEYTDPSESIEFFDEANQSEWFMPEEYQKFPMHQWLIDQCKTELEKNRVDQELLLFIQHGMYDLLFYLKYLVDTMRSNNIVWGVGRGSSVASYVLFLIGVHKINSIKYNLDITEFLRQGE